MTAYYNYDVLIIGSGAAGLTIALNLPDSIKIGILSKNELKSGSTKLAQGGIAAVLDVADNQANHMQDTLAAGANLNHTDAVEFTVSQGKNSIEWLIQQGVVFSQENNSYHLTKEGGHSHRRIIHSTDATGMALQKTLLAKAKESKHIDLFEHRVAVDLITRRKLRLPNNRCVGAYVFNPDTGHVDVFQANNIVLATGGASKAYLYTSNPDGSTGDGIAMAWRAGCRVSNMEFNQFHPTCLYHPQAKSFLISEAVRGEGGRLILPNGKPFMQKFDERAELAPRDIVARAIDHEMKRLGCDCLYLDISHKSETFIKNHFPNIYKRCIKLNIDIAKEPIPIVPAAHYTCGGIMTNQQGQTDIPGLYAIGEAAFTGLHGANRLASNSLLECLVYAKSAADSIKNGSIDIEETTAIPAWDESLVTDSDEDVIISHNWNEIRHFMWDYVGIVRTNKRLQRAKHRIDLLHQEIREYYNNYKISNDLIELRNLALVADLIIRSATLRKESRGLHYTLDYPELSTEARDTILAPANFDWKESFVRVVPTPLGV